MKEIMVSLNKYTNSSQYTTEENPETTQDKDGWIHKSKSSKGCTMNETR